MNFKIYTVIFFCISSFCCAKVVAQNQEANLEASFINKNILKTTFLSWYTGSVKLTYERYLAKNQSIEITGGDIGSLINIERTQPKGVLCRLAYKFIYPVSLRNKNYLNGFYVKPELAFSSYSYNHVKSDTRKNVDRLAIMGNIGYQSIFKNFVIDIFGGLGIGVGDTNESNYHHGFIGLKHNDIFAFTAGVKIGWAF